MDILVIYLMVILDYGIVFHKEIQIITLNQVIYKILQFFS